MLFITPTMLASAASVPWASFASLTASAASGTARFLVCSRLISRSSASCAESRVCDAAFSALNCPLRVRDSWEIVAILTSLGHAPSAKAGHLFLAGNLYLKRGQTPNVLSKELKSRGKGGSHENLQEWKEGSHRSLTLPPGTSLSTCSVRINRKFAPVYRPKVLWGRNPVYFLSIYLTVV